jgi:hypothetical protein
MFYFGFSPAPYRICLDSTTKNISAASHNHPNLHFINNLPSHTNYCINFAAQKAVLMKKKIIVMQRHIYSLNWHSWGRISA